MMKPAVAALAAAFAFSGCVAMASGPVYHGASPQSCANIIAMANQTTDPAAKAYALQEAKKIGC
ncbi:MAG: hypothetical protein J0L76_15470 [Rhodobacterales bacterium]|nr:hypothetical protein [Rhodobacterales bacterium]